MAERKRVSIIYTGGTLGMRQSSRGWVPEPGYLQRQMARIPVFQEASMPDYSVREFEPLRDSAEMGPADWVRIARAVAADYDAYDGFLVLHGTDTMAYSASALAFMLEGLAKPVLFTGAQLPLCEPRSDGQENLVTSLLIAAGETVPEVCLYFGSRLFRGCRSVKVNCHGFDAFDSPNLQPLARAGISLAIEERLVRRPDPDSPGLRVHDALDPNVGLLWLFPGITGEILRNFLQPPLRGAVLQAFGLGNGPVNDPDFVAALREASQRGVVLVDCTQCLVGTVDLEGYATGAGMKTAGAVSGYDMTPAAALTKLMYLFGRGCSTGEVRTLMQRDLRGELTEPA